MVTKLTPKTHKKVSKREGPVQLTGAQARQLQTTLGELLHFFYQETKNQEFYDSYSDEDVALVSNLKKMQKKTLKCIEMLQ